jgi:acetylglutamate kinase
VKGQVTRDRVQRDGAFDSVSPDHPLPSSLLYGPQPPAPEHHPTLVVKLGGSVGAEDTLPEDLQRLQAYGARVALVHGGGPQITSWLARLAIETRFVSGLRYTDGETLDVVRMVLAGLVNGEIVARLGRAGVRAIGLCGSDDGLLRAVLRDPALGLVGDVTSVNVAPLQMVLDQGYVAVVAPIAVDDDSGFLNVNADTAAAHVALALAADRLIYLTDVDGVSDASGPLRRLTPAEVRELIADGVVTGGMIPKVDACLLAVDGVREAQIIDGRKPHALSSVLERTDIGTTVVGSP